VAQRHVALLRAQTLHGSSRSTVTTEHKPITTKHRQ
jgi:hypothetical protein